LKRHSKYQSITTPIHGITYPELRVFHRPHPQADQLPTKPSPLPLLVFIHGLGGSVAQFHPLLTGLVNLAPCLAIDLPGCGLSTFSPKTWDAYKIEALAEAVAVTIEKYLDIESRQGVVLVGHSLGCSITTLIASKTSPLSTNITKHVRGLIAICPRSSPPTEKETRSFRRLLRIPGPIFDLWRRWDRRGGAGSASVARFVGRDADSSTKALQLKFNEQSRTPVWRRMAWGSLPVYDSDGEATGGIPGKAVWAGLELPVLLVAGAADQMTKAEEVEKIAKFLGKSAVGNPQNETGESLDAGTTADATVLERISSQPNSRHNSEGSVISALAKDADEKDPRHIDSRQNSASSMNELALADDIKGGKLLKTITFPPPASHALLYVPSTSRILAALVTDFLWAHVSRRLSLGWQLQYLSTEGKWDVKNLLKWRKVAPVSSQIGGIFRSMKTLREVDEEHRPDIFAEKWGDEIKDVVDISHESPVYDPRGLEKRGVRYYKFPTVSKIPPTDEEVESFNNLIDRIRAGYKAEEEKGIFRRERSIGVHCHYGYNRTGYFIVCYLVDRSGYALKEAIEEFGRQKPPGIRHEHFINALYVRYYFGLKKQPTF
jgi:pimeloyl-ACP methyl ester carboxylesterase/protein-tyrosine phosphatase